MHYLMIILLLQIYMCASEMALEDEKIVECLMMLGWLMLKLDDK